MKHKKILALALSALMLSSVPVTGSGAVKNIPSLSVTAHAEEGESYIETHENDNSVCEFINGDTLIFRPIDPTLDRAYAYFDNYDNKVNVEDIRTLIFEEGITGINASFDYSYRDVETIIIPSTLKCIDYYDFDGLYNVKRIDIPDLETWLNLEGSSYLLNYENSEAEIYVDGELLTDLVIPEGVTEIRETVFANYSYLKSIYIPASVTKIGEYAFWGSIWAYNDIESIVVSPENPVYNSGNNNDALIETASKKLLRGCHKTVIPEDIVTIGMGAFALCRNMKSISIPDSVEVIEPIAFEGCFALSEVNFGKNVREIGEMAFHYCFSLRKISIPDSVKTIGRSVFSTSYLEEISLGKGVETIGEYAFVYSMAEEITVPESVRKIGEWALGYVSPKNVTFYSRDVDLSDSHFCLTDLKNPYAAAEMYDLQREYLKLEADFYAELYSYGNLSDEEFEAKYEELRSKLDEYRESYASLEEEFYKKYGEDALDEMEDENGNPIYQAIAGYTITGYKGSTAESYANKYGITFIALDEECKHENIQYNDYIAPTCTEPGFRGGSVCLDCETVIDVPEYIEPTGHKVVTDKAVPVTCTVSGLTEGQHCSVCGAVIKLQETIIPVGHTDNNGDNVCDVCGEEIPGETVIRITFFERIIRQFANIFDKIFNIFKKYFSK